jgi:hypothetical protein
MRPPLVWIIGMLRHTQAISSIEKLNLSFVVSRSVSRSISTWSDFQSLLRKDHGHFERRNKDPREVIVCRPSVKVIGPR